MIKPLRKTQTSLMALLAMLLIVYIFTQSSNLDSPDEHPLTSQTRKESVVLAKDSLGGEVESQDLSSSVSILSDEPFMPKMENATLKAELGRASWKLFHTILARYPMEPSASQRQITHDYLLLFAQVYPCGDCARHFNKLITQYPPQLTNRNTASVWGCDLHNKVNKRLEKEMYDCANILEDYDCGCGADEADEAATAAKKIVKQGSDSETKNHLRDIEISVEDKQLG